jgi:A/G-specific adenine glycosylase
MALPETLDPFVFQKQILAWYELHKRDLPWRGDPDPYHILVSEVMLQQTQVDRVIPQYRAFLHRFPDLQSLADASPADVIRGWQSLGYNRRALNLKRLANVVMREFAGQLPGQVSELEKLPGIGHYTASAVACFAYGAQIAVVDTNVRRVLSGSLGRELSNREAEELSTELLPVARAADWNQALMDYGAVAYKAKRSRRDCRSVPFESTNRFWRGRIVDTLRNFDRVSLSQLVDALPGGADFPKVHALVLTLREEGMLEYDAKTDEVSLKGA